MMVYGAFILAVLLFLPHGISGLIDIVKQSLFKNRILTFSSTDRLLNRLMF